MELAANKRESVTCGSWQALPVQSKEKNQTVDITAALDATVKRSEIRHGSCHLFVPHPNAVILLSVKNIEELDSLGLVELIMAAEEAMRRGGPVDPIGQASVSETIPIENGGLRLREGWGVYVLDYEGPRELGIMVKIENTEPQEEVYGAGH